MEAVRPKSKGKGKKKTKRKFFYVQFMLLNYDFLPRSAKREEKDAAEVCAYIVL